MGLAQDSAPDSQCCRILIDALYGLNRELQIPSPKSFGIDRDSYDQNIEKMTADAADAGSTANNPLIPTAEQIKEIYSDIYDA